MKVQIYTTDTGRTLENVEMQSSEVDNFLSLLKKYGYEDEDGTEYEYNDAGVCFGGFVIYVTFK